MKLVRLGLALVAVVSVMVAPGSRALGAGPEAYMALGDSFTAGPLIPVQQPNPIGCGRSDNNYPHVVARSRGRSSATSAAAVPPLLTSSRPKRWPAARTRPSSTPCTAASSS